MPRHRGIGLRSSGPGPAGDDMSWRIGAEIAEIGRLVMSNVLAPQKIVQCQLTIRSTRPRTKQRRSAIYAAARNIEVVKTYADEGKSGLREALINVAVRP